MKAVYIIVCLLLLSTGCTTFAEQECRPEIKIQETNTTYYIYTRFTEPMNILKNREVVKICPDCSLQLDYSASMRPLRKINTTTLIGFRPENINEVKTGNSIVFYADEDCREYDADIIHHRIIGRIKVDGEILFITKGDLNRAIDECPVRFENIIATAMREVDSGGIYN